MEAAQTGRAPIAPIDWSVATIPPEGVAPPPNDINLAALELAAIPLAVNPMPWITETTDFGVTLPTNQWIRNQIPPQNSSN
jgi:hypothetical protein